MATERLAILLEAFGTSTVVKELEKVSGATRGLGDKATSASGVLKGLKGSSDGLAGSLGGSGLAISGAVAALTGFVGFGAKAVGTWHDMATAVVDFSRASGASMEDSSRLVAAFDDVGVSTEAATKGIFQLGKRIEENSIKLSSHGVAIARDVNGNTDLADTLLSVADAYTRTADPVARATLLTDAFGRSGRDLIPLLERGREGIEELFSGAEGTGQIFTDADRKKLLDYNAAMDDLEDSIKALSLAMGETLVPVLADAAEALAFFVDKARGVTDIPVLGWVIKHAAENYFLFKGGADSATEGLTDLERKVHDYADAQVEANKITDETIKALLALPEAQRAYEQAGRAVENADRSLADARKDLNKLMEEGAVDEEKVADARERLNEATRSLGHANRTLAKTQEEYNDAQAAYLALPSDTNADALRDASDNLADAKDGVASATDRQKDAQRDLAKAQAGDPEFNDKLAAAKLRVKDAELGLTDAVRNQSKEAYELNAAVETQNRVLDDNAAALAGIRSEWEQLIKLKPEVSGFLSGPLAALSAAAGGTTSPGPGFGLRQFEGPTPISNGNGLLGLPLPGRTGTTVVFNNTFNTPVDPAQLARQFVWDLN